MFRPFLFSAVIDQHEESNALRLQNILERLDGFIN